MKSASSNPHLLEERGHLDDSQTNEEDRYGAVLREDAKQNSKEGTIKFGSFNDGEDRKPQRRPSLKLVETSSLGKRKKSIQVQIDDQALPVNANGIDISVIAIQDFQEFERQDKQMKAQRDLEQRRTRQETVQSLKSFSNTIGEKLGDLMPKKLNVNAAEFKPNFDAPEFVPSFQIAEFLSDRKYLAPRSLKDMIRGAYFSNKIADKQNTKWKTNPNVSMMKFDMRPAAAFYQQ